MEEIVGSEAIQAEILEDAKKKAERILEEAEAEAARNLAETEAKAASIVEEILTTSAAKSERYRMETMARFPLEKTRMRSVFVDARLREAASAYVRALSEERIAALAEAMLAKGAPFLAGKAVILRRKGLGGKAAGEIAARTLGSALSLKQAEDPSLPAPGLVAASQDGSVTLKATMDLVEGELLDERRGELAKALCAGALAL
jgi:vacuolar-type H+-ATPase subunit E/Vma4